MSFTATKRPACERCRDQKLRCDRGELASGELSKTCARCLRAGASCVSSNPRPLGRPPASAANASSDRQFSPLSRRSTGSATHSVAGRRIRRAINVGQGASHGEQAATSPGSIFTWDLRDPSLNGFPDLAGTLAGDTGASNSSSVRRPSTQRRTLSGSDHDHDHDQHWPASTSDGLSFLGLPLNDSDALLESLNGAQPVPELSHQLHLRGESWPGMGEAASARPMNTHKDAAGSGPNKGDSQGTTTGDTVNLHDSRGHQALQIKPSENPLLGLSRLSESITRQIGDIDSYPWGPAGASLCAENVHGSLESNPVAKALQSTSDFISIVQQMNSSPASAFAFQSSGAFAPSDSGVSASGGTDGQNSFGWSDPPSPANPSALDAPVALLVMSNYLLLLQLYDRIIHRVLESLRKLLNLSDFFQTGPDVCIRGLPPMKGHLYIKILVQIIDDHVDRLEQLLGLPAHFRLSRRQGASSAGILSGVESSGLLQLVMAQLPVGLEGAGTELVVSLRSKMRSLRGILQG